MLLWSLFLAQLFMNRMSLPQQWCFWKSRRRRYHQSENKDAVSALFQGTVPRNWMALNPVLRTGLPHFCLGFPGQPCDLCTSLASWEPGLGSRACLQLGSARVLSLGPPSSVLLCRVHPAQHFHGKCAHVGTQPTCTSIRPVCVNKPSFLNSRIALSGILALAESQNGNRA